MNSKTWIQQTLGSFLYRFAPLQHYKILRAASQASSKTVSSAQSVDADPLLTPLLTTPKAGFENASEMINSLELSSRLDELLYLANPGQNLELKPSRDLFSACIQGWFMMILTHLLFFCNPFEISTFSSLMMASLLMERQADYLVCSLDRIKGGTSGNR